jgi:GT2 family glycosyltransferase
VTTKPVCDDVTIVIPTIGRDLVHGCLESIADGGAWPARLIVVDQGSRPSIAEHLAQLRARGLDARHLPMAGRGIAAALNHGVAAVRTPYVVVTHDDCRVASDWLERHIGHLRERDGLAVATGRVLPEEGYEVPSVMTATTPRVYREPLRSRDVLFPANMACALAVWAEAGPMDEDPLLSRASEDNEWAYRVLRAGIPIIYDPGAVVWHLAWRDHAARREVEWVYARASGAFYGKYLRQRDSHFLVRVGSDAMRNGWRWLRGALTGDRTLSASGRAGSLGLLRGVVAGFIHGGPVVAARKGPRG